MSKIKIRVDTDLGIAKAGEVIEMDAKQDGSPKSRFWRRRLNDAARDHCCEIVSDVVETKPDSKSQAKRRTVQQADKNGSE